MAASSSPNSPSSPNSRKKARTKHACDECRRSQKKCDGESLCQRCRSNGTKCVYTPHKSRSHCACVGQSGETRLDTSTADIHFFSGSPSDATMGAFPIWPMSSPESHPGGPETSSSTPSPTSLTHADLHDLHSHVLGLGHHLPQMDASPGSVQLHAQARRSHSVPNLFESSESLAHAPRTNTLFDPSSLPDASRAWDGSNPGNFHPTSSATFNPAHGEFASYSAAANAQNVDLPLRSSLDATLYDITSSVARDSVSGSFSPHDQRRPANLQLWNSTDPYHFTNSNPSESQNYGNLAYAGNPNQHLAAPAFTPTPAVSSSSYMDSMGSHSMQMQHYAAASGSQGMAMSQSGFAAPSQDPYSQEFYAPSQAPSASAPSHHVDPQWMAASAQHSPHSPQSTRSCPNSAFPSPPAFGNSNFNGWP